MNYDMRYHPMDDVTRPASAAARKAAHGLDSPHSILTSESTTLMNESDQSDDEREDAMPKSGSKPSTPSRDGRTNSSRLPIRPTSGRPSSRRISRGEERNEKPKQYDMGYHPIDDFLPPNASRSILVDASSPEPSTPVSETHTSPPRCPIAPRSGSPANRRLTRGEKYGEKPVQYDAKHHPMDDIMRPNAAKKVLARSAAIANSSSSVKTSNLKSPNVSTAKHQDLSISEPEATTTSAEPPSTAASRLLAPAVVVQSNSEPVPKIIEKSDPTGWKSLKDTDRVIYLLQKGAHPDGDTLPLTWPEVARTLERRCSFPGGFISIEGLRHRYAVVHRNLQAYYHARPEPTHKDDTVLHYAEDFDVYDYKGRGTYWRHGKDSVVKHPQFPNTSRDVYQDEQLIHGGISDRVVLDHDGQRPDTCNGGAVSSSQYTSRKSGSGDLDGEGAKPADPRQGDPYIMQPFPANDTDIAHAEDNDNALEEEVSHIQKAGAFEASMDYVPAHIDACTTDDGEDHGLYGSYNDAEAYIRQVLGRHQDSETQESPERDVLASLRNEISADVDEMFKLEELDPMFQSPADEGKETENKEQEPRLVQGNPKTMADELISPVVDETESEDVIRRPLSRRPFKGSAGFSVHEDQPGNTPKIKRQIAMNPKSPGTDLPKENWQERSPSVRQ
ncbi:MAG: hypothetical protein Q9166_001978 [cf. Caloplaca sp. 2 TL-2023]